MDSAESATPIDYHALAEFRYQIRRFLRFSELAARSAGLEPQQYQLLLALKGLPTGQKATVGVLAERLQIQHHSTVELINRLVERVLVQRQRDEDDQRQVLVILTAHGEELLHKLARHHHTELQSIGPTLVSALENIIADNNMYRFYHEEQQEKETIADDGRAY